MKSTEIRIQFHEQDETGRYNLAGRATAQCPVCNETIEANGHYMACHSAVVRHIGRDHGMNAPAMA